MMRVSQILWRGLSGWPDLRGLLQELLAQNGLELQGSDTWLSWSGR